MLAIHLIISSTNPHPHPYFLVSYIQKVLGLLVPSAVDLTWYMSDEAVKCIDLAEHNYRLLEQGLKNANVPVSDADIHRVKRGDLEACVRVAEIMWQWLKSDDDEENHERVRCGLSC